METEMASSTTTPPSLQIRVAEETAEFKQPSQFRRLLPGLTTAVCIAFGVALIANTQLACDGGWFWYAVLHHAGTRLYRDLHLVLQPLAVLETEWWMSLVGKGWIVSKVPAVIHLVAFTTGIALVTAKSKLAAIPKAIVVACVFFVGIHFEAYRFDDYHVMADALALFSILLLLKLDRAESIDSNLKLAAALGFLSGLAIMTRLTDGMALCLSTALAIAYLVKTKRAACLIAFFCFTCLVILGIVVLTGDSVRDYATSTILHAAGPKGGLASVLTRPWLLLWNTLVFLVARQQLMTVFYCGAAAASWTWLVASFTSAGHPRSTIKATVGLGLLAGAIGLLWPVIQNGDLIVTLSAVWVITGYGIVFFLVYSIALESVRVGGTAIANPKRVILFLPFALLLAGSMSSAGYHFGLYAPIAFLILAVVVLFPAVFERRWLRSCFLVIAALMAVSGACSKTINPASWHSYRSFPMFAHRILTNHPTYGTMVIDDSLHDFVGGICSVVKSGGKTELLSIPFSYANYYCDIPPWQGFVQTFFDLSGKEVINDMMAKLQHSPPKWVLYQRQLEYLTMHEKVFNNGRRLPQRDLDEFIVANVIAGRWKLVMRGRDRAGSDWLLLRTD
jgi:hypothetical protein